MSAKGAKELEEIIAGMPEDEVRGLLRQIAAKDVEIRNAIVSAYAPKVSGEQLKFVEKELLALIRRYSDRDAYVVYGKTRAFVDKFTGVVERCVGKLLEQQDPMPAFRLVRFAFLCLDDKVYIDESSGGFMDVADFCCEQWGKIIPMVSPEEKRELYQWFASYGCHHEPGAVNLRSYTQGMLSEFTEPEFQNNKLQELDARIAASPYANGKKAGQWQIMGWEAKHDFVNDVLTRLRVMAELYATPEEIREYRRRFRFLPEVRQLELEDLLASGKTGQAVALLRESKKLDQDMPGLVARHCRRLMEIYQKNGQTNLYKKELWDYILHHDGGVDAMLRYKASCTGDEWLSCRAKLLSSRLVSPYARHELMHAEGMYQELFDEVSQETGVDGLLRYEEFLKPHFAGQMRDRFVFHIRNAAPQAVDRQQYQEWMRQLKRIAGYPGGADIVRDIVAEWRSLYARRKALLEELSRAGF